MLYTNIHIIAGNVGAEPSTRETANGTKVTTFSIATNESFKDSDGKPQTRADWHRVKCFGRLAEIASEYLDAGSEVQVQGAGRSSTWTDDAGIERHGYEIEAKEIKFAKRRTEGSPA